MYLFFKQDGSIEKPIINEYIMQGSSGVNYIYVYFTGRARATYLATAFITLPNTDVVELAMRNNTFVYDGVEYAGYRVPLDGACTSQGGEISINVTLTDVDENVLATYTFVKTVNATSVVPTTEINYAQYMALISMIFTMKSYNLGSLSSLDSLDTEMGLGTYTFDYLEQAYYMFVSKDDDDNIIQTYITANAGAIVIKSREYDIVEETWGEWSTAQESNLIDATATTITSRAQLASVVAVQYKLYIVKIDIESDADFGSLSCYSAYLGENNYITLCGNGTIYMVDSAPTYSTFKRSASKAELSAEIAKIVDGTTIALKASQDDEGHDIVDTYATKTALSGEVSRAEGAEGALDTAKADKATTLSGYGITDAYTKTEVNNLVSSVYKYKGSVDTFDDLPTESLTIGDVYNVVDSGINYAWNGSAWDDIGGVEALATLTNDGLMSKEDFGKLQDLYTKAQLDTMFGDKADQETTYTKTEVDDLLGDGTSELNVAKVTTDNLVPAEQFEIKSSAEPDHVAIAVIYDELETVVFADSFAKVKQPLIVELSDEQVSEPALSVKVGATSNTTIMEVVKDDEKVFKIADDKRVLVASDFYVGGDIYQKGSAYETHAEQVYTTKDHIILRDGAVSGLGLGQYTGLFAKIPDGTHDAGLIFDGNNTARVGDITYNEDDEPVYTATQALATRQDTPTDKGVAYYNATDYRFDTASGLLYDGGNLGINVSPTAQLHVKASANDKVAFIVDSGASPTAHLADWKINGVIKAFIGSTGNFHEDTIASNSYGVGGSTLALGQGATISHDINDANSALTINNKRGTGNIATFQYGNATKSAINKDGVLVDNSGSVGTDGTFLKKVSGAMAWTQPTKSDVGLGNVANPNIYGNIAVSEDLDAIVFSGLYTCYGTATGVPNADYSWFVFHMNSGVGTTYAKQIAFAYDGKIFERFKNTTWGAWKVLGSGNGVDWTNLTLETGWTAVENYTPQYKVMPHGAVYVRGRVTRGTGGSSTITILPSGLRPSQPTDYINSSNNGGSLVVMSINSTGTITSSATEGTTVELNYTFAL